MAEPTELSELLAAIHKPLVFACRNDFEHLDRVRDLAVTLRRAVRRARELAGVAEVQAQLDELAAAVPEDDAPRAERVAALSRCLRFAEALAGGEVVPASQPSPPRALPAPQPLAADDESGSQPRPSPSLDAPVQYLKGVGPKLAELLNARGLCSVEDLLRFLPRRYEDRRGMRFIRQLEEGSHATIVGTVMAKSERRVRGRRVLEVALGDESGVLHLVWFRVPGKGYADRFVKGRKLRVSGQVKRYRGQLQIAHPETTLVDDEESALEPDDAIVPVYPEVEGLRPAYLRRIVERALPAAPQLVEVLPRRLRQRRGLPTVAEAIASLHRPAKDALLADLHNSSTPAYRRLAYEELFLIQLVVLQRKAAAAQHQGLALDFSVLFTELAAELFPFALTGAQARVLGELEADLRRPVPANRLLQGDVGSGKTAVAVTAAAAVARAGYQTAIMAPTEILAEQHARLALQILTKAGIRTSLLTSAASTGERREILAGLASGQIQTVIGTHALIQDDVRYRRLALAVVDEQHRFGVLQRARLLELGRAGIGVLPHMLVMTATPIPRTLAMTVYGDLDVSLLDEMPPGRTPVQTLLFKERARGKVYERVRREVEKGRQAYVVFPLVEESEAEGLTALRDATSSAAELAAGPLAGVRLGLLHGRMSGDEKDQVMRRFIAGEIQVLVATTVIEVGIDVANATMMVVEHAERFGLSQLHQLRGRVGRGEHPGLCLLVSRYTPSEDAWRRLKIIEKSNDGFRIAEEDLAIRGPGDFLGTRQSGLPPLAVANLARDQRLLQEARDDAAEVLAQDPELERSEHAELKRWVTEVWQGRLALAQVG